MDILNAYREVAEKHSLPKMMPGGYSVDTDQHTSSSSLWAALTELAPNQGWLLFQSWQMPFEQGLPEREPGWGTLLSAEACTEHSDRTLSITIEQDGCGGWVLTTYTHDTELDGLYDEVKHLVYEPAWRQSADTAPRKLCYRRYWQHDAHQGYLQSAACFIGFE